MCRRLHECEAEPRGDSAIEAGKVATQELLAFLHKVASSGKVKTPALFETAAAYCAFMLRDLDYSRQLLSNAKAYSMSPRLKDQWQLTSLLVTVNAAKKMDAATEREILPSVKWLAAKAIADTTGARSWHAAPWKLFYRNLLNDVIAKRYRAQGDRYKEALAVGSAQYIQDGAQLLDYSSSGPAYMRDHLGSADVAALHKLTTSKTKTPFETYLVTNNSIQLKHMIDFAGTAYLRDNDYKQAITWFSRAPSALGLIEKDPFKELLFDQEERLGDDKVTCTKLTFAREMLRLQDLVKTDKAHAADHLYKMALAYYNTTYYGYAWEVVEYNRSGSDGYYIPKDATAFVKNYYGCFLAHDQFKRAMDASTDKEFRAKCLFMMAKCSQKQIRQPQYGDFPGDWDKYEAASKTYYTEFRKNQYFPQLKKEFGQTRFYQEAYNTCSYLRDFQITN